MREKFLAEEETKPTKEPASRIKARGPDVRDVKRGSSTPPSSGLEAQLQSERHGSEDVTGDIANAEKGIKVVQSRIESTPVSEQQYADIIRDREVAKLKYDDLNKKRSQSQIAEDLERRQQGETLEVLDPASLPQSPTQPKRPSIIGAGAGLGLVLGLFLAGAREAKDTR